MTQRRRRVIGIGALFVVVAAAVGAWLSRGGTGTRDERPARDPPARQATDAPSRPTTMSRVVAATAVDRGAEPSTPAALTIEVLRADGAPATGASIRIDSAPDAVKRA